MYGRRTPYNVVLIGYRGSGKTSVGRLVAQKLKFGFVDCDLLAVDQAGMDISAYVAANGWPAFRRMETQILQDRMWRAKTVVATGGGAVLSSYARSMFQRHPFTAWLAVCPETVVKRIRDDENSTGMRPALGRYKSLAHEVKATLSEREPYYAACADFKIDTDWLMPEQIADEIVATWHLKRNETLNKERL